MNSPYSECQALDAFVEKAKQLCRPKEVYYCDGSKAEYERFCKELVAKGIAQPLAKRKGSYLFRSDPSDVARVEDRTFICSKHPNDAGPTNNWADPDAMKDTLSSLFDGCMEGRTMYVIPFLMGPVGGKLSYAGVEITDSPYVVINMYIMARMGQVALDWIKEKQTFIPCMHSVGYPLPEGKKDLQWPCNTEKYIVHFPEDKEIWSYGSGYGGNALLGKKCFALRLASTMAKKEGWLAEHMLIVKATSPAGESRYLAAAFPSACGKTNFAMLKSNLKGWEFSCLGDDIAWMYWGDDGRLYAINPESGYFGVVPGTSMQTNPYAMQSIAKDTLFTNVAYDESGDVWWEGHDDPMPKHLIDWKGGRYDPNSGEKAAHPNARFTVSMRNCPIFDPAADDPVGVPIDAILFGGRRAKLTPLVMESRSWQEGVFYGASLSSEKTAAAIGSVGELRNDPMAMLPFCGYHMADYLQHWLSHEQEGRKMPKIYSVNWFKKDASGNFLWPGFGDNTRVVEWIFDRLSGKAEGRETAVGILPTQEAINFSGLSLSDAQIASLLEVDEEAYKEEYARIYEYFLFLGDKMPDGLCNIAKSLL